MRIEWNRAVKIASIAAFFAAIALDQTVPVVTLSVLALVDRTLVALFMRDEPQAIEEQAA